MGKNVETEEIIEKPYTLRKLKDGDLFPVLQIFKKIGMKEFKGAFTKVADGKPIEEVGLLVLMDIAIAVIDNADKAEAEIYSLWADIAGITVDELKDMEFGTLPLMIMDSFGEVKNTAFFKVLSKLL